MKIHNCYQELEKTQRTLEETMMQLQKLNNSISTDLSELYNRGWKDENYTNLKSVLTERSNELNQVIQHVGASIDELKKRISIIKNYYSISL